jgi:hypothetical protein
MTLLENIAGGSVFYFIKGTLRSSSMGCRLAGGVQAVITNGRRVAAFLAVLSAMEANLHARHVQGPLNKALASGAANAIFSVRRGTPAAVRSGLKAAAYGATVRIAIFKLNAFLDYLLIDD